MQNFCGMETWMIFAMIGTISLSRIHLIIQHFQLLDLKPFYDNCVHSWWSKALIEHLILIQLVLISLSHWNCPLLELSHSFNHSLQYMTPNLRKDCLASILSFVGLLLYGECMIRLGNMDRKTSEDRKGLIRRGEREWRINGFWQPPKQETILLI